MYASPKPALLQQKATSLSSSAAHAAGHEYITLVLHPVQYPTATTAKPLTTNLGASCFPHPASADTESPGGAPTHPTYGDETLIPVTELSARTHNALLKGRITTLGHLCALELADLKWLRNFGAKAVAETVAYRARLGVPMNP